MTARILTGSDLVVRALANAGGIAARTSVLRAVSRDRGRREAGLAIELAVMGGRVEKTLLPDGILGLRLVQRDEWEATT